MRELLHKNFDDSEWIVSLNKGTISKIDLSVWNSGAWMNTFYLLRAFDNLNKYKLQTVLNMTVNGPFLSRTRDFSWLGLIFVIGLYITR